MKLTVTATSKALAQFVARTLGQEGCWVAAVTVSARPGATPSVVVQATPVVAGERGARVSLSASRSGDREPTLDLAQVEAVARAFARRSAPVVKAPPPVSGVTVDRVDGLLTIAGGPPVQLTERELALIDYLAGRAGKPVTRAELAESVWHEKRLPSNVLDVYIRKLRKKLGAQAPLLQTVRGVGYRLAPIRPNSRVGLAATP